MVNLLRAQKCEMLYGRLIIFAAGCGGLTTRHLSQTLGRHRDTQNLKTLAVNPRNIKAYYIC